MSHPIITTLKRMNACTEAQGWASTWASSGTHLTAWQACNRSDWMLWLLARTTVDQNDPRLRIMACDFAEAVLHLVPAGEDRPLRAIEVARRFAAGEATRAEMAAASAAASDAAWAAASDAASAAASAAARAAASDAASAAASAAARTAASDAAWAAQCEIIRRYFPECPSLKPEVKP